ncbi:hypothetical protein AMTRI_Chr09g20100 [Amborella trichopoda]
MLFYTLVQGVRDGLAAPLSGPISLICLSAFTRLLLSPITVAYGSISFSTGCTIRGREELNRSSISRDSRICGSGFRKVGGVFSDSRSSPAFNCSSIPCLRL